ncbi:MAG: polyprenol monophosphomannose synthase [Myxococcota bacterium]
MKTVVLVPTWNESENVVSLLDAIGELAVPGLEVLVVDDASPDGTADQVRAYAETHPFASVIERRGERGRGHAGREGYLEALARGADRILEMDADLSHDPGSIPALLAACESRDVVLGSRFVSGGLDKDRALWRRALTRAANLYIRVLFGVEVRDANSGFRCFRREALLAIEPEKLASPGPAIVQEVLFRASRAGLRIGEIPVVFTDRVRGSSKLGWPQLWDGYWTALRLRARQLLGLDR